jgi:hypothetical protein
MALDLPPIVVKADRGGYLHIYERRMQEFFRSGRRVKIDGLCASACTMYLALGSQVCVTPKAQLWFHTARKASGEINHDWNRHMLSIYPVKVRAFLGNELRVEWKVLKGAQLRAIVQQC